MPKILVIDDDPEATVITKLLLGSYGMEVTVNNSGLSGILMARAETFDLVMIDMTTGEMDGQEVCKAIRSFSKVPILAYSGVSDPEEIIKAKIAGATDYLQKPTPSYIIVEHIHKLMKRG